MTGISSLKLVVEPPKVARSAKDVRRKKMCSKLEEQLQLAQSHKTGDDYSAARRKRVRDPETGEVSTVEEARSIKPWWRIEGDKTYVTIRYGARPLPIAGGKATIETNGIDGVIAVLEIIKAAAMDGELDSQIEALSVKNEGASKRPTLSLKKQQ